MSRVRRPCSSAQMLLHTGAPTPEPNPQVLHVPSHREHNLPERRQEQRQTSAENALQCSPSTRRLSNATQTDVLPSKLLPSPLRGEPSLPNSLLVPGKTWYYTKWEAVNSREVRIRKKAKSSSGKHSGFCSTPKHRPAHNALQSVNTTRSHNVQILNFSST